MEIYNLQLVEKIKEFDEIYTLKFKSDQKIDFKAGQWAHLGFLTPERDKSKIRHMSFASAPNDEFIEFTMDLGTGSLYKNEIKSMKNGDTINAFKIKGEFNIDENSQDEFIFLSGGIGITPIRSIIRDLESKKSNVNWKLIHVSRDSFLYETEFTKINKAQWRVNRQNLDKAWEEAINFDKKPYVFISGSNRFVEGMIERLAKINYDESKIIVENFNH